MEQELDETKYTKIYVGLGKYSIIDKEDEERVKYYNWCIKLKTKGINGRSSGESIKCWSEDGKVLTLSKFILNKETPKGFVIDHINRNPLDNRKENLRLATKQQNAFNTEKYQFTKRPSKSKYKGVRLKTGKNPWIATLNIKGKSIHFGCFKEEKEAAEKADLEMFRVAGIFAYLNFPEKLEEYKQKLLDEQQ